MYLGLNSYGRGKNFCVGLGVKKFTGDKDTEHRSVWGLVPVRVPLFRSYGVMGNMTDCLWLFMVRVYVGSIASKERWGWIGQDWKGVDWIGMERKGEARFYASQGFRGHKSFGFYV